MSYHIYTTPSLVLRARPLKEADRVYILLTRDLGLIRASATGVRKEVSKLRPALEPFSLTRVSLVKGKEHWRITSAILEENLSQSLRGKEGLLVLARVFSLLEKLIRGESANQELFDSVEKAIRHYNPEDDMFEMRLVAQVLFHLGYLEEASLSLDKKPLVKAINEGLIASGLV